MKNNHLENRLAALRTVLKERKLEALYLYGRENTRYFSGFSGTASEILLTDWAAYIFVDSRYGEQARRQCPSYEVIQPKGELLPAVAEKIQQLNLKTLAFEDQDLCVAQYEKWRRLSPGCRFEGISEELEKLRWIKDHEELEAIRQAVRIADEAFAETWPQLKAGMCELSCAALLDYNMKKRGASGPSFDTIVASGLRSAMPHGVASEKRLENGDLVVMDFGCVYHGYCSDITRSFFIGYTTDKLLDLYNLVLQAQLAAERGIKAGMTGREGDSLARGLIQEAGYGDYFGHGLGHSLGLAIHESPRLSQSWNEPLPAGALITVEPGIYVPGLGGVRIEDTALIKEDGLEVLTQSTKDILVAGR